MAQDIEREVFEQRKIGASMMVSNRSFIEDKDVLRDLVTMRLETFIYDKTVEDRDLVYFTEPPTFLDWLFKRRKRVVFKFEASKVLLNPPSDDDETIMMYNVELKPNN